MKKRLLEELIGGVIFVQSRLNISTPETVSEFISHSGRVYAEQAYNETIMLAVYKVLELAAYEIYYQGLYKKELLKNIAMISFFRVLGMSFPLVQSIQDINKVILHFASDNFDDLSPADNNVNFMPANVFC